MKLTFDDGPSVMTPKVLAVLARHNVRATFFVVGSRISGHENLLRAVAASHEIGNHLWSHTHPYKMSDGEIADEICRTADLVERLTGTRPRLVRQPWLEDCGRVAAIAATVGAELSIPTLDSQDWKRGTVGVARRIAAAKAGDVVLLHDGPGFAASAVALRMALPVLRLRGLL